MGLGKQVADEAKKIVGQAETDLTNGGREIDQKRLEEEDKAKKLINKVSPFGIKPFG